MVKKSNTLRNRDLEVECGLDPYSISTCTEVEGRLVSCHTETHGLHPQMELHAFIDAGLHKLT